MKSIAILFERYTHMVYGVCFKYFNDYDTAKDGVMNIFEKLITDLKVYEIKTFKWWLYSVVKNYCLIEIKKNKNTVTSSDFFYGKFYSDVMESDDYINLINFDETDPSGLINEAINSLNEEQKKCVELFFLYDMSYAEIALSTGFSLKQVKSYIQNGKRNMKIYLTTAKHE